MHRNLKLVFLKLLVNVPLRLADRILPEPRPACFPQTAMMESVFDTMGKVYRLEVKQGIFTERNGRPDGNFDVFLRVSRKILSRIAESDRYYRAWLGLGMLLCYREVSKLDLTGEQLLEYCKQQWLFDVSFLPRHYVEENRQEFLEMAFTDYLCNLAEMKEEDWR